MMQPHALTLHRRAARKLLPLPARRAFVRRFDAIAWRERQPGSHHRGQAAQRREDLKNLARNWSAPESGERTDRLRKLAHPSLTGWDLEEAFDALQGDLALLDGLNGTYGAVEVHWSDVDENLTGPDRTEAAREEMEMRVGGALDRLIRGKKK